MTFSIVARVDDGSGAVSWGVAVASKFLAVGAAVPAAISGIGAVATQADANVAWKGIGLSLLDQGLSADEALARMLADDDKPEQRQVGIVDASGGAVTHTGTQCMDWAGGFADAGVAMQGNILTGPEVVEAMRAAWFSSADTAPLAHRLLTALAAGDAAGGDSRGRQSAALLVVRAGAGYGGLDDVAVDLRVDDHPEPITELTRLLDLNDFYLTPPAQSDRVAVDDTLAAELAQRAQALGHRDFDAWVGTQNYEMRVAEDGSWVDQRVLDLLRASATGS